MEESQMATAMQVVPYKGTPPVGLNFRPSSGCKPFTLFCCFNAQKRIFPVTHHTHLQRRPPFPVDAPEGLPFLLSNRGLRGVMIRWAFQGNLSGHGTEDALEWGDTVSMESRTVINITRIWPKVADKKREERPDPEVSSIEQTLGVLWM